MSEFTMVKLFLMATTAILCSIIAGLVMDVAEVLISAANGINSGAWVLVGKCKDIQKREAK